MNVMAEEADRGTSFDDDINLRQEHMSMISHEEDDAAADGSLRDRVTSAMDFDGHGIGGAGTRKLLSSVARLCSAPTAPLTAAEACNCLYGLQVLWLFTHIKI